MAKNITKTPVLFVEQNSILLDGREFRHLYVRTEALIPIVHCA
jgi:hypothetical protein